MIIVAIIVSLIIGIVIGFIIGTSTTMAYMRYCILKGTTPLRGDELDKLKKFVNYNEKRAARIASKTDRGERILSQLQKKKP
jgi:hypothetical protein